MESLRRTSRTVAHSFWSVLIPVVGLVLCGCTGSGFTTSTSLLGKSASQVFSINQSASSYMGVNTFAIGDYSPEFFADAIKSAREWGPPSTPCWGTTPAPTLDANGWPMGDAGLCMITGASNLEYGTYSLSFTGQATAKTMLDNYISVQNLVYNAATNTTTADVVVTKGAANMYLILTNTKRLPTDAVGTGVTNVKLMRPGQSNQLFAQAFLDRIQAASTLRLMDLLGANGTLASVWSERRLPTYSIQKPFGDSTQFIAWEYVVQLANVTGKDIWINIPDQATDDYVTKLALLFKYGSDANGNVYTSPQSNPVWAPLNNHTKVYIEYSNELWNWMFYQTTRNDHRANAVSWVAGKTYAANDYVTYNGNLYICEQAIAASATPPTGTGQSIADGGGTWAYMFPFPQHLNYDGVNSEWYNDYRLIAERILQISNIFRTQMGDAAMGTQYFPVFASQVSYPAIYEQGLYYLDTVYGPNNTYGNPALPINHYIYGLAGAPYYTIPSLNSTTWPTSCSTSMATCTNYSNVGGYATKAYVTANGNLYRAVKPITQGWQAGKTYYDGTNVVSNGNMYVVKSTVTSSVTAPSGTGTSIADGAGIWGYVSAAAARAMPTGTGTNIADGDGSWSYVYTYGDTVAETNQAFIDLNEQIQLFVSGPQGWVNELAANAKYYGLVPLGYEGGLDTSMDANFVPLVISDAFQNDPRMATVMTNFYNAWFSGGGKLLNYYALAGMYGQYGTWGLTQNLNDPNTVRMETFVELATMYSLPNLVGGNLLPTTLSPTSTYNSHGGFTSGTTYYLSSGTSTDYEVTAPTAGNYVFTTTVHTTAIQIFVDGSSTPAGTIAVGTNSKLTLNLTAGIHVVVVKPAVTTTAQCGYDPIVITQQ